MQKVEVNKGEQVYAGEGWGLFASDVEDVAIMVWEDDRVGRFAWCLHQTLRSHALSTNGLQPFGHHGVAVKQLDLLELTLEVRTTHNDTQLTIFGRLGAPLNREEAERVPHCKPTRLATMEDVALHTARTLRAHLAPMGLTDLVLKLRFGIAKGGETLLQVVNPLDCDFGTTDYAELCERFGK